MGANTPTFAPDRLEKWAHEWRMTVDATFETHSSFIAYGRRRNQPVVLKVVKQEGDEGRSGEVLEAFTERGVVRVYEYVAGAVLLERLSPGNSLVDMAANGSDQEATDTAGVRNPRPQ